MFITGIKASVQAGAGVVADSVPIDEHNECINKSKALLAAVPGARLMTQQRNAGAIAEQRQGES